MKFCTWQHWKQLHAWFVQSYTTCEAGRSLKRSTLGCLSFRGSSTPTALGRSSPGRNHLSGPVLSLRGMLKLVWFELSDNKHEPYLSCLCEMPGRNCLTIFAQFWSLSLAMAFRGNQASTCSWLCRVWVFDFRIFIIHQHSWEAGLIWSEEFWIHNVKKPGESPVKVIIRQDQGQHTVCVSCMLFVCSWYNQG